MGVIITFPTDRRPRISAAKPDVMGRIVILPAIRIERYEDAPNLPQPHGDDSLTGSSRARRRRLAR